MSETNSADAVSAAELGVLDAAHSWACGIGGLGQVRTAAVALIAAAEQRGREMRDLGLEAERDGAEARAEQAEAQVTALRRSLEVIRDAYGTGEAAHDLAHSALDATQEARSRD